MKTSLLYNLMLFILVFSYGYNYSQKNELIPREAFFTGENRFDFVMDESGKSLYFRSDKSPNTIFSCISKNPEEIYSTVYPGKVVKFIPTENELLTIWQDSIYHLDLNGSSINIPHEVSSIKLVSRLHQRYHIALEIKAGDSFDDGIYLLNIKSRQLRKKFDLQPMSSIFFDKHFNLIAGNNKNEQGGNSLYYFKNNEWRILESHDWEVDDIIGGFSKVISVSDDGKTIYYTSNLATDKSRLYTYDIGSETSLEIAQSELVDLLPFGTSVDTKGNVTSVVGLYAKTIRIVTDQSSEKDFEFLRKNITGEISFVQAIDRDKKWLIRELCGGHNNIYLFDRPTQKLTYLLSDFPILDKENLASRWAFTVTTRDSLNLPVHVYLPYGSDEDNDGIPNQPLPTVMYIHGGPWVGVVHWNQSFHCRNFQLLANRGYAVIVCEFRGSTGLGKSFVEKSIKKWGTDMTNDNVDIAKWAVQSKIVLENKIALWGWSYGGYATLAGLTFSPETYACGVAMYGISDLVAFGKTSYADNEFWKTMVGDAYDSTEVNILKKYSPINYVENIKVPLLITTGSKDQRVPQSQMDTVAVAMEKENKDVIYFYYPDEVHDYRESRSWISFWAVTEQFLKDNLNGEAEPIGDEFELGDKVVVAAGRKYIEGLKNEHPLRAKQH